MNKHFLSIIIAASLGLTGCGGDSKTTGAPTIDPDTADSLNAETKVNFDIISNPSSPVIVTPTYLAMDSYDGTIATDGSNLTSDNEQNSEYLTDISNPSVALGKIDGWGTLEPITINFTGNNLTTEPSPDSFVMIESFDPTSTTDSTAPSTLEYGIDYVVSTQGSSLVISLLKPLKSSSNYMFAVTNSLKDEKGMAVGTSGSYAVLKASGTPPSPALIPAQTITHATENTITSTTGVNKDKIIFSTWFTTESVGDGLYAAKAAIALSAEAVASTTSATGPGNASSLWGSDINTTSLFSFTMPTLDTSFDTLFNSGVKKYTGSVKLPYFLGANTTPDEFLTQTWKSATPSLAKILNVISRQDTTSAILLAQLAELNITAEELAYLAENPQDNAAQLSIIQKLLNTKLYLDQDKTQQLDAERLITKFSPAPQLRSVADVPYNLYMPATTANCSDPSNIPVSIFGHGFTSNNDSVDYYSAVTLASNCQAIISIDLPLHGDRWNPAFGDDSVQSLAYMNLQRLPVARDNIRQSVSDLMSLRAALGLLFGTKAKLSQPDIDGLYGELGKLSLVNDSKSGVGYLGVSLGGIVGIAYTATMEKPVLPDNPEKEAMLFGVTRSHVDVPGGGIAYFLFNSDEFGGTIQSSLKSSEGYTAFKESSCENLDENTCDKIFFNTFAYAAQSVLDTTDPANLINDISTTPVYLSMAQGDTVIPNGPFGSDKVLASQVAGTIPMIQYGGFNILSGESTETTGKRAVLYKQANSFHGALLTPPQGNLESFAASIADMQANSISFLSNGSLPIAEPSFIYQLD
ncbi:VolA/Pla-1 family phospholipase [Photobacterium sp. GB-36]|uniref:VolA/Pla-1 family phospholipase n=1 Tax=Photobacterium sp. GB-36 TaxID=2022108 RepID=UPI000D15BEF9|nr:VolA/Pla-1 family phospholipase [Photobacterium sp. GB-36]PSV47036.1 lipase [Photobacterium sp. GB-36]